MTVRAGPPSRTTGATTPVEVSFWGQARMSASSWGCGSTMVP